MARLARAVLLVAAVAASGGSSSLVDPPQHQQGAPAHRAAPVVSVRDFGAVADGKTDSSAAFQAALAHAVTLSSPSARATVVVPGDAAGRRYLVANVSLPSGVDVAGDAGAAILMPASANMSSEEAPAWYLRSQCTVTIPQLMMSIAHVRHGVIRQ